MLEKALGKYQKRSIEASQAIEEFIDIARQIREANQRREALGLTED